MAAAIISAIIGVITAVVSVVGTVIAVDSQQKLQSQTNQITQQNNEFNQELATEEFDYTKEVNKIMWDREDNAIQRRAADLAAAGINPMLAGLGGAQAQGGQIYSGMPINNQLGTANIGDIINGGLGGLANNLTAGGTAAAKTQEEHTNTEKNRQLEKEIKSEELKIERYKTNTERYEKQIENRLKSRELDETERNGLANREKILRDLGLKEKELEDIKYHMDNIDINNTAKLNLEKDLTEARLEIEKLRTDIAQGHLEVEQQTLKIKDRLYKALRHHWLNQDIKGYINEALNLVDTVTNLIPTAGPAKEIPGFRP